MFLSYIYHKIRYCQHIFSLFHPSRISSIMDTSTGSFILDYTGGTSVDFPLSSNTYTAPANGVLMVNVKWAGQLNGVRCYVNGNEVPAGGSSQPGTAYIDSASSAFIPLASGDIVYFSDACRTVYMCAFYPFNIT